MNKRAAGLLIVVACGSPTFAHRLDEYLQATTISIDKNRIEAQIRLTPGVSVVPFIMRAIDTDGNGVISSAEQRVYAEHVLDDLSLSVDGDRLKIRLVSMKFPEDEEIRGGLGEIQIEFRAEVPSDKRDRKLVFENHHLRAVSAYLVNCLVPRNPALHVMRQSRDYLQSRYELDYLDGAGLKGRTGIWLSIGMGIPALLLTRFLILWRGRRPQHSIVVRKTP